MMKHRWHTVIDCGMDQLAAGAFSYRKADICLERFASSRMDLDSREEDAWLGATGHALKKLKQEGWPSEVRMLLPGSRVLAKVIRVPEVEASRHRQVLAYEVQQALPYPLGETVWASQVMKSDGVEMEVLCVAAKKEMVERFLACVREAGFEPESITAAPILGLNALRYSGPEPADGTFLADIGTQGTYFVFSGGAGSIVRTIQSGVARDHGAPAGGVLHRIGQELVRSVLSCRRQEGGAGPQRIGLTGVGSSVPGLRAYLAEALQVEVDVVDPLRRVRVAPSAALTEVQRQGMVAMVGEAVRPLLRGPVALNLLPAGVQRNRTFLRRRPWLLAAAACLAAAPLAPWLAEKAALARVEAQVVEVVKQRAALQSVGEDIVAYTDTARMLEASLERIEGLVAGRSNWIRFLADLQDSLASVGDVWLEELQVVRGPETEGKSGCVVALGGRMLLRGTSDEAAVFSQKALADRINGMRDSFARSAFVVAVEPPVVVWTSLQQGVKVLPFRMRLVVDPQNSM